MTSDRQQSSSFPWKATLFGLVVGGLAVVGWLLAGADDGGTATGSSGERAGVQAVAGRSLPAGHPTVAKPGADKKLSSRALLEERRFLEAFDAAKSELEQNPGDLNALYAQAMVRMRMGQRSQATILFDQILAQEPGFSEAAFVRGTLAVEDGDLPGAMAIWERGLAAAGGEEGSLSHVLALARQGKLDEGLPKIPLQQSP